MSRTDSAASVGTSMVVGGGRWPSFQVCGYTGFLLSFGQSMILIGHLGLSLLTLLGITGVVILTFFGLVMATKIVAGEEIIIYYHHEIVVSAMVALFLRMTGQPMLPYLDITVLGIGLFLACGRLGCLIVGCCHGRPWRCGVIYSEAHARTGFPAYLVGVRLFPIQAVESVFALCLVALGITAILRGYAAGTAFALYVLLYAVGRFYFEFARGDERPYCWGFSEAQWTSLAVAIGEVWAEHAHLIPHYRWHITIPCLLLTAILIVRLKRSWGRTPRFDLLHPKHVRELAEAVRLAEGTLSPSLTLSTSPHFAPTSHVIDVAQTSLGFRISTGDVTRGSRRIRHYSLSHESGFLSFASAGLLGAMIGRLRHACDQFELVPGNSGVFHLIYKPPDTRQFIHGDAVSSDADGWTGSAASEI